MPNNTAIATETVVRRVALTPGFDQILVNESDVLGAQGYLLRGLTTVGNELLCVYQRTR
ncbi:MAG: hypothetical protein AB7I01_07755 [Gammaproteobacteria bacterium]